MDGDRRGRRGQDRGAVTTHDPRRGARIRVSHPHGGALIDLHAPMPDDLCAPLERMGFEQRLLA